MMSSLSRVSKSKSSPVDLDYWATSRGASNSDPFFASVGKRSFWDRGVLHTFGCGACPLRVLVFVLLLVHNGCEKTKFTRRGFFPTFSINLMNLLLGTNLHHFLLYLSFLENFLHLGLANRRIWKDTKSVSENREIYANQTLLGAEFPLTGRGSGMHAGFSQIFEERRQVYRSENNRYMEIDRIIGGVINRYGFSVRSDAKLFLLICLCEIIDSPIRLADKKFGEFDKEALDQFMRDDLAAILERSAHVSESREREIITGTSVLIALSQIIDDLEISSTDIWGPEEEGDSRRSST